jgi:diamine N-acetyltransferase
MKTLKGTSVELRALEPEDLEFVYAIENDESVWEISQTQTPYSRFLIKQYLENAQQDIFEAKQLRLAICKTGQFEPIGLIDLFEFDPKNKRAGVGILISNSQERNKGFASESLELLTQYCKLHLGLHQLFANIDPQNSQSIRLFENHDFQLIGIKKDWNLNHGVYQDECLYQLIF